MNHRRPLRGTVHTGPAPHVLPWQVECVVGNSFRCHIGRIHDEDAIDNDSEFSQSRFSANQQQRITISPNRMTSATLNRNITSMEKSVHSAPVKTGSSPIYVKTSRGRITTPSTSVDDSLGYATWKQSIVRTGSHDTYFVLHKLMEDEVSNKWCISIVDDDDVVESDIKIACFKYARGGSASRANLIQLWKSDIYFENSYVTPPFHVTLSGENKFKVKTGAVNNKVPANVETELESEGGDSYIYIVCPNGDEANSYGYPSADLYIEVGSEVPADDDDNGHILLASYVSGGLNQIVSGSLWSERHKFTTDYPASYYFYKI